MNNERVIKYLMFKEIILFRQNVKMSLEKI